MKILCLIIARGGSKSLPNKNIMKINNLPLIAYSILQAKKSKKVNRVIVSTDSEKIAKISKKYGAEILFKRPKNISGDLTTDYEVFSHALNWLKVKENYIPDWVVDLRAPEPIRSVKIIDRAIDCIIKKRGYDSLRSINASQSDPRLMWQLQKKRSKKVFENKIKNPFNNLSKKYFFWQNGYIDIIKSSTILKKKSISGSKILPFKTEEITYTIDYKDDLKKISEILKKKLKELI
jgi:CMP-N,N'-diacetyllegionaminic acid synthase